MSESTLTPLEASRDDRALRLEEAVVLRQALATVGEVKRRHNILSHGLDPAAVRGHARIAESFDMVDSVLSAALIAAKVYLDSELADYALSRDDEVES